MPLHSLFDQVKIASPKQYAGASAIEDTRLFPYYAGYSTTFTQQLLSSLRVDTNTIVLDPWNGSGTTTQAASYLDIKSVGFDLNPVMVLVAKASLVSVSDIPSLSPLAQTLLDQARSAPEHSTLTDPLCHWFIPSSTTSLRRIEREINRTLISHSAYSDLTSIDSLDAVSPLAAFFYVCLFRTVRRMLATFIPTNPTWVKSPRSLSERKRPKRHFIHQLFLGEVELLVNHLRCGRGRKDDIEDRASIHLGDARHLPLTDDTVDIVVTSPPYCTRIDYAVATAIELAVLRVDDDSFSDLRRSLMGTSTVEPVANVLNDQWGATCANFLRTVYNHTSKASQGYYYKNHVQYFSALHDSIMEIGRVVRPKGAAFLVVQDSFYKDVHNDVAAVTTEMAEMHDLVLRRRSDFVARRSMVGRNRHARSYVKSRCNNESVLCFERL